MRYMPKKEGVVFVAAHKGSTRKGHPAAQETPRAVKVFHVDAGNMGVAGQGNHQIWTEGHAEFERYLGSLLEMVGSN